MNVHVVSRAITSLVAVAAFACLASCTNSSQNPTSPSQFVTFSTVDLVAGTGAVATVGSTVTIDLTAYVYDASKPNNEGLQFTTTIGGTPGMFVLGTGATLAGVDLGLPGMRVGGVRRFVIPPALAYGSNGTSDGTVLPNTAIVVDVTLDAVQ